MILTVSGFLVAVDGKSFLCCLLILFTRVPLENRLKSSLNILSWMFITNIDYFLCIVLCLMIEINDKVTFAPMGHWLGKPD